MHRCALSINNVCSIALIADSAVHTSVNTGEISGILENALFDEDNYLEEGDEE